MADQPIKRLNYFPRETDAEFSHGKCFSDVTSEHGMVGPRAAVLVTFPGRGTVLLYLSYNGLHWTDGVTTKPANTDIDWTGAANGTPLIEPTLIHRSVLEAYPKLSLVSLSYVPYGGTRKTKTMWFSYHQTHLKEDLQMPAIGPITCSASSVAAILVNGVSRLFSGHSLDGKVYLEDSGTADESGTTPTATVRTRRFIAAGVGREGRIERFFLVADGAGDAVTGGFTAALYRQNQGELLTLAHTMTDPSTVYGGLIELWPDDSVETFEMVFEKGPAQTAQFRLHYIHFQDERSAPDVNG